jgi:F-type H+-transporting ATPase subunit gamma
MKSWQVLEHLTQVSGRDIVHPLLAQRKEVNEILVVLVTGDRGLAGAYNTNVVRFALETVTGAPAPVKYVIIGRKGRDMIIRRGKDILAEFSDLPAEPTYADASAIGRLVIDEYLSGRADQVFLIYTDYINLLLQVPTVKKLLPLEVDTGEGRVQIFESGDQPRAADYIYEPDESMIIDHIVPRFTQLQVYHALLESLASEHAARMVAMQNATDNALQLSADLRLEYNKARQLAITSDILDIVGGAEALTSD